MQSQIIVICVILIVANAQSDFNEICSSFSGRRIYLDQNGSGYIQATNITASNLQNVRLNFIFFVFVTSSNFQSSNKPNKVVSRAKTVKSITTLTVFSHICVGFTFVQQTIVMCLALQFK